MDWYIKSVLQETGQIEWTINDIRKAMQRASTIKPTAATILKYNAHQFEEHQTAPLERISPDTFQLNDNYYRLLGEAVRAPQPGQRGRPRKYPYGDDGQRIKASKRKPESCTYSAWYHRLMRRPKDTPLAEVFSGNEPFDVPSVQRFLHERILVKFGHKAASTILNHYVENDRGLQEIKHGVYRRVAEPPTKYPQTDIAPI